MPVPEDDSEQCLPWRPLPSEFSGVWQVEVVYFAEAYDEDSVRRNCNLSLAIAAYSDPTNQQSRKDRAWRLDFSGCPAYRKRIIHYNGAVGLTKSDDSSAFWEIIHSQFLRESDAKSAYQAAAFHDYVIISAIHDVYEILAAGWHCEPLPDAWAKPFSTSLMPRW